jgi:hypothetical protein
VYGLPYHPELDQFEMERLPIRISVEEEAPVIFDRHTNWFCVTITLLPEDGGDKYAVMAKRVDGYNKDNKSANHDTHKDEEEFTTPYHSAHAQSFIGERHSDEDEVCRKLGGVYVKYGELQSYIAGRFRYGKKLEERSKDLPDRDILETHVRDWNKKFATVQEPG